MEGDYGALAKKMRDKFFAKQEKGYQICYGSLRTELSNIPMVSDSDSSDSESESSTNGSDHHHHHQRQSETDLKKRKSFIDDFYPPKIVVQPTKQKLFSDTKKPFFVSETKQREKQWTIIVEHWYDDDDETNAKITERINELLANSIPKEIRSKVWCLFASSYDLIRKSEGIYELCLNSRHNQYNDAIWSDVRRTLPDHPCFCNSKEGQQNLFNILRAYSSFNPSIGYVQCMNFIVGYLYTQIKNTEMTFWTFVSIMQNLKGLFVEGLPLLKSSMDIFEAIIRKHLPVLYAHFEKQKFNISPIVSRWCSTLFCCAELPYKFSIHFLDIFLYKGYEFIFKAGLCLLAEGQNILLKLEGDSIQQYLQHPAFVQNSPILIKALKYNLDDDIKKLISHLKIPT